MGFAQGVLAMQVNAIKKCAAGAMLVGATLGMSQTASAALTWLGTYGEWQSANQSYLITSNVGYEVVAVSLATESLSAISSSVSRNGFVGSVDYSETTGPGFSVSFSANGSPGHFHVTGARLFTVTGTESISINVTRPQNALVILDRVTDGMHESVGQVDSGVLNVDLTAGTYRLAFVMSVDGQAFSGQTLSVVPAPGALALLGAAGLVGKRRRR
jgi:MYXO-CTERM domain-containing protein